MNSDLLILFITIPLVFFCIYGIPFLLSIWEEKAKNKKYRSYEQQELLKKEELLSLKETELRKKEKEVETLKKENEALNQKCLGYQMNYVKTKKDRDSLLAKNQALSSSFDHIQDNVRFIAPRDDKFDFWNNSLDVSRLYHALSEKIEICSSISVSTNIRSSNSNELYETTLSSCTCRDFKYNTHGKPCKHMYALAWHLGIIRESAPHQLYNEYLKYTKLRTEVEEIKNDVRKIINTRSQRSPWLAKQLAEYQYEHDIRIADHLTATNPRIRKTDELKRLAKEKRELLQERNMLRYQLDYLLYTIPWLEEYITTPPKKDSPDNPSSNPEWDAMKYYLSAEEYAKLSSTEKYQLALDRYNKRKKNKWEIGIGFERYIGSIYENRGYKVQYRGAIDGLEDMGRDIIAEGNGITYIIQCKRWSQFKTIHEKHIFQLYGTYILYKIDHPETDTRAIFVTTASLSERASAIANYLGIRVREHTEIKDYPQIKCNIGKSGEKIYHLPFDQQYDHIVISREKGECYCSTVAEAEELGFRRAKKWIGSGTEK